DYSSSESTRNRNSRKGPDKKPDIKGYLRIMNHLLEIFFAEVSSGPFEPTSASLKHEKDDYTKLILLSKDAYNYIREKYSKSVACIYELDLYAHPLCRWRLFDKIKISINDSSDSLFKAVTGFLKFRQKFKENLESIKDICLKYLSNEHNQNLDGEVTNEQEFSDEESEEISEKEEFSDEDIKVSSEDSTESSEEELKKCKNGALVPTINNN
ncbi:338_t:CDS:2, partial [Diversispora eburnea]